MTDNKTLFELTVADEARMHPIDPRMDREPAGSLLLARAGAIRNAERAALRYVAMPLAMSISSTIAEAVLHTVLPRSSEFIRERRVLAESRTEASDEGAFYRVELKVVLDMDALTSELERLNQ